MTWITCHPNADFTGSSSWPAVSPSLKIAAANSGSIGVLRGEVRQLAAALDGGALVALRSRDRIELVRIDLELRPGRARLRLGVLPGLIVCRHVGRGLRVAVGRVQDVTDLDRAVEGLRRALLHEDLGHLALRAGHEGLREDRLVELGPQGVAPERRPEGRDVDALRLDLALKRGVDDRLGDLGHPADAQDAVLALDDLGRGVLRGSHQGIHERRVEGRVLVDEPEVAALVPRLVRGHCLGDVLPGLAGLEVGERLLGRGPRLGLARCVGGAGAFGDRGLDGDHPRVAELGCRRLLGEARVDVRIGHRHALFRGELLHDPAVDQLLEGDGGALLLALVEDVEAGLRIRAADLPGGQQRPDAALRVVVAERVDLDLCRMLVLGDRLAVDAAGGGEVLVVPGRREGDDEQEQRCDDRDPEADVQQHRASVPIVPGASTVAGRPAARRRHGMGSSSWLGPSRRRGLKR